MFSAEESTAEFRTATFFDFRASLDMSLLFWKKKQHGYFYFIQQVFYNFYFFFFLLWHSGIAIYLAQNHIHFSTPNSVKMFWGFYKWNVFLQRQCNFGSVMSIHCTQVILQRCILFLWKCIYVFFLCVFSMQYLKSVLQLSLHKRTMSIHWK